MLKLNRLAALAAIVAIPAVAVASTTAGAQTPYTPYTPYTPAATATPAPVPTAVPNPAPNSPLILQSVKAAVDTALKTLKFSHVLGQGHSTVTIPITGAGTYTVTFSYRLPGKKYQSIAKGATIVKTAGKTTSLAVKPNAHGKSVYKTLKKQKKTVIKIQVTVSYETGGKTVSTTYTKQFHK